MTKQTRKPDPAAPAEPFFYGASRLEEGARVAREIAPAAERMLRSENASVDVDRLIRDANARIRSGK